MYRFKVPAFMKQSSIVEICVFSISTLLFGVVIMLLFLMKPVADDYAYFSDSLIHNPFKFAVHYYEDWTGRFMQAFWMSSLYRVFDNSVVTIGGVIQLLLLIASSIFFSYSILYKSTLKHSWVVAYGLLVAIFALYMSPSLVDSGLWITSTSVYLGSFIAMAISLGFAAILVKRYLKHSAWIGLLCAGTFLAQLFSEPTSLIMIYFGTLGTLVSWFMIRKRRNALIFGTYTISAVAGFLFMYLSPGTRARQGELDMRVNVLDVITGALSDLGRMSYIFTSYRIFLILILALLLTVILSKAFDKKMVAIIGLVAGITSFAVPLLLFLSTRYTMGSYVPMRAFTVPAAILSLSLAMLLAIALIKLPQKLLINLRPFAIIVLLFIGIFTTIIEVSPTIRAIAIRSAIYDGREESIRTQLSSGSSDISVEPLPILLPNTEAVDLFYNDSAPLWLEDGFKKYHRIPSSVNLIYEDQPEGYCVIEGSPMWLGAKDCHALQRESEPN